MVTEELSYSLPFPLDQAHFGSVERGDEAWVVVAPEQIVEPVLQLFPKAHLEAEPLCYLRAARASGIQRALVIDLGASKTVFCGLDDGQVGNVRVLLRGGDKLTEEIAKCAGCSTDEAESIKIEEGLEHRSVREFFLELLQEALLPNPLPYQRVLVCGGGSATPGLFAFLSKQLGADVDVEPFPVPDPLSASEHVAAYGAALAGRPGNMKLRMNQEHRYASIDGGGPLSLAPLVLGVILMVLMAGAAELRLSGLKTREIQLKESLVAAVSPVLGENTNLNPEQLASALRQRLELQRAVDRSSPARVMNVLGQSAEAVTSKSEAMLYSIVFEENKVKLEGRATSLKQSEDIRTGLEQFLVGVEQVKTRPGAGSTFIFQIEGQLPEQ